jgi:hypothetical protein
MGVHIQSVVDPVPASCYRAPMLKASLIAAAGIASTLLITGCEKAGPKASGKLTDTEHKLMSRLPKNASVAIGGNLVRLQRQLAKSPLMKLSRMASADSGVGADKYQDCILTKSVKDMMGTGDMSNGFDLRFVMTGIGIDALEDCAKQASVKYELDSDKKFITISVGSELMEAKAGYLVLDDGALYGKMQFNMGLGMGMPKVIEPKRADFEADIARAAKENATQDDKLISAMEKADRSKGIWFAGDASKTPIGDKLGEFYGWMDLEDGLEIDATGTVKDKALAKQAIDGLEEARSSAGILGPDFKKILEAIELKKSGDDLRLIVKVSNKQLEKLAETMESFGMGGGRRGRPSFDDDLGEPPPPAELE